MTQDVQARTAVVHVTEVPASVLEFSIPEDLLPESIKETRVFSTDNPSSIFEAEELEKIRKICKDLLRCSQIDHLQIARRRCRADRIVYTDFKVQTITEIGCTNSKARGRVDAALRAIGYEPRLFES